MSEEGCALVDWDESFGEYLFAKHPKGFPVFLPTDQLNACDEYREKDPYGVEAELSDDWHIRRVDCTWDVDKGTLILPRKSGHKVKRIF